jgi:hypothetical protein
MKPVRPALAILAASLLALLASASPALGLGKARQAAPEAKPVAHRLTFSAALAAADEFALDFAAGDRFLDRAKIRSCSRKAPRRMLCRGWARGTTEITWTSCRMVVEVRVRGGRPRARLWEAVCDTWVTLLLTGEKARQALLRRGARVAGQPVELVSLERLGKAYFAGTARWIDPASKEPCYALMTAGLTVNGKLDTSVEEVSC